LVARRPRHTVRQPGATLWMLPIRAATAAPSVVAASQSLPWPSRDPAAECPPSPRGAPCRAEFLQAGKSSK
jgi:hypothetical protein